MTTKKKMTRARIALLLDQVFFGALLLNLKPVEDKAGQVPIMGTDGARLIWNAKGVDQLTEPALGTVLAHEALHCALLHHLRRGDRDIKGWNRACDEAVNNILEEANEQARAAGKAEPFPWPDLPGIPKDPQYRGKAAEEIYYHLKQQPTQPGVGPQDGAGSSGSGSGQQPGESLGDVLDGPADEAGQQAQEAQWKCAIVQAAAAAKGRGQLPAALARLVDDIINPSTPWQEILRAFVRENCKDDYSWTRPNARYAASGFILPSLHSQRLGRIAVAVDTSASIDVTLLNSFLGELEVLMHECRPAGVTLIDCDAHVNNVRELEPTDPLPRDFAGGGGTDFRPVFAALEADPPAVLVYFTDLDGTFPDTEPGYPVLWASYDTGREAPFGSTIQLDNAH